MVKLFECALKTAGEAQRNKNNMVQGPAFDSRAFYCHCADSCANTMSIEVLYIYCIDSRLLFTNTLTLLPFKGIDMTFVVRDES